MTRVLPILVTLVLLAVPVRAEHEVFYRYTVIGFVRDAGGAPLADQLLEIVRDKTDCRSATEWISLRGVG